MIGRKAIVVVEKINDTMIDETLQRTGGVIKVVVYPTTGVIEVNYDPHSITERKIVEKIESLGLKVIRYITEDILEHKVLLFKDKRKKIFLNLLLSIFFLFLVLYSRYLDVGGISILILSFLIAFISSKEMYLEAINSIRSSRFDISVFSIFIVVILFIMGFYSYISKDFNLLFSLPYLTALFIVILFFNLYEYLNSFMMDKMNIRFENLFKLFPAFVTLLRDGKKIRTHPMEVMEGDFVEVLKGERVSIDGVLVSKKARIKQPLNTFDNELNLKEGDFICSGGINEDDNIIVKATKDFKNSMIYQIIDISKRFYEKRKDILLDERVILYYFYLVFSISVVLVLYGYFKLDNFSYIYNLPIFFFPVGYYFSFLLPYFFATNYLSKNGVIINNPSAVFNLSGVDMFIIDGSTQVFKEMEKKDFEEIIKRIGFYGFKIVFIIPQYLVDIVKDFRDVDYFVNLSPSEKHSVVLRYKVFGYKIAAIAEGSENLGMLSVSEVGIEIVGEYDNVSKISDVVLVKKRFKLIFDFITISKKMIKLYKENLYLSVLSSFLVYIISHGSIHAFFISAVFSVGCVFLNSFRVYLKD